MLRILMTVLVLLLPLHADAAIGDRWRARKAAKAPTQQTEMASTPVRNISYGPERLQKLDLYMPKSTAAAKPALVVFIHGGGWSKGDKAEAARNKPKGFTDAGYAFASLNYRLSPDASIADMQSDLAQAVAKLRALAGQYGYDPNRIILSGHSAGAHLAALLATDTRALGAAGVPLNAIAGVVLLDGAGYSLTMDSKLKPLNEIYEDAFGADKSLWPAMAPLTYVASAPQLPPFLIVHVASRADSRQEAQTLASAITKRGVRADVYAAAGKSHKTLNHDLGLPGDAPTQIALRFIAEVAR